LCFYCMFETFFLGTTKCGAYAPHGYGPEGSPDDQSITKGIVRNDETCMHIVNFVEARAVA